MNKELALSALAKIDSIVYASTHDKLYGKDIDDLEKAANQLDEAVLGDNFAVSQAFWIRGQLNIGYLGSTDRYSQTRQEILGEAEKLARYVKELADSH